MLLLPSIISPSITYSAFAIASSSIVIHFTNLTASFLSAPAIDNSLNPSGVVGGSKQEHIDIAGSTPYRYRYRKWLF